MAEFLSNSEPAFTKFDRYFSVVLFSLLGTAGLYPFNAGIIVFSDTFLHVFHTSEHADTMVLCYQLFNIFTVIYFMFYGGVRPKLMITLLVMNVFTLFLVPLTLQLLGNSFASVFCMHLAYVFNALTLELILGISLAFAAIFPKNFSGYVGFGLGASGLAAFVFWYLADRVLFKRTAAFNSQNLDDPLNLHGRHQLMKCCWFMFGMGSVQILVCLLMTIYLLRRDWALYRIKKYWAERSCRLTSNVEPVEENKVSQDLNFDTSSKESEKKKLKFKSFHKYHEDIDYQDDASIVKYAHLPELLKPRRIRKVIIGESFEQLFNVFFVTSMNMLLYPMIGPYAWNSPSLEDLVIIFQVVNFSFRLIPNWGSYLRVPRSMLIYFNVARLFFLPFFIMSMAWRGTFANTFAWHACLMMLFAASYGWISTQSQLFAPETVTRLKEKGRVGAYAAVSRQLGMLSGTLLSKILKISLTATGML